MVACRQATGAGKTVALAQQLITPLLNDARAAAADGLATPADIDTATRLGAGHPQGPFEMMGEPGATVGNGSEDMGTAPGRATVIGTGTMATGIAEVFARAGTETTLVGRDLGRATAAVRRIDARLQRAVERGKLSPDDRAAIVARLSPANDLSAAAGSELVIEAVVEQLALKRELLAELETAAPGVSLATNTSSFRVDEVSTAVARRDRVLALHFFNPALAMRLVEVVGGADTDPELVRRGQVWARGIGKTTVTCRDEPGFLVNRLLIPYLNDASRTCAAAGIAWEDADTSARDELGHPMGPHELMDLIGLDVMVFALETMHRRFADDRYAPSQPLRERVGRGHLGRKSGLGFHEYGDRR